MHRPRKRFGQNFLVDPPTIQSLISVISPSHSDSILEIGPGLGALTKPLLNKVDHLEVIELDRDLISQLQNLPAQEQNLTIHNIDALKFNFSQTQSARRIVGNLPYNISTPLIFHLLDHLHFIIDMHFMLQKEVVERICAKSGSRNFGRLSAMVQSKCTTELLLHVPPESFSPAPKVDSAFLRLTPLKKQIVPDELTTIFQEIVKKCFSQPRKTIANNLKNEIPQETIKLNGIDPSMRPQQLQIEQLVLLANLKNNQ